MATQDEIKEVLDKTDVVSVVSRYLPLEKSGKNYKGLCPFHSEKTPSFVVSPEKKLAKCFGCGGGGTIIDFVMQIENLDFGQALNKLADEAGVKLSNAQVETVNPTIKRYHEIMESSLEFYNKYLLNTEDGVKAKKYLADRGITDEIIEDFKIGLAPNVGNTLYRFLKEFGYYELDMVDVGLISSTDRGYFDSFAKRIMFPICDEVGNVIAYSGRIYTPEQSKEPKYINSPETPIFKKNEVLFNLNNARGNIRKNKRVILHEGQMDVIATYKTGIKEVVCSLGTALNQNHVNILKKYTNNVLIAYDGDKAGINASKKAIKIFTQSGFNVRLVLFPDGMDPDEYVKKYGPEGYKDFLNKNIIDSYEYEYIVSILNKDLTDSIVVEAVKNDVFSLMQRMPSNTMRDEYLKKLAKQLNVGELSLSNDFDFFVRTHTSKNYISDFEEQIKRDDIKEPEKIKKEKWNSLCEIRLFMYAKSSKEKALRIDSLIQDEIMSAFSNQSINLWVKLINEFYVSNEVFSDTKFIKLLNVDELAYYLEMLETIRHDKTPYNDLDENLCIEHIKIIATQKEIERLDEKIKKATPEKKAIYLKEEFELKKKLMSMKRLKTKKS